MQNNVQKNKPKPYKEIEVWADSFKEGEFILEQIKKTFQNGKIVYEHGFLPTLEILIDSKKIKFIVYGYYSSWTDIPIKISNLLEFGKPDGIIYEPIMDKIILAYEETAAVPTGNQSQQRLERVWYSAKESIPFVYLLGKYGLHKDGKIRTTSIWPSYLALKLSSQYCVPSLTLLYGSKKQPENYNIGNSLKNIQAIIQYYLVKEITNKSKRNELEKILVDIFKNMSSFIAIQYKEIVEYLPAAQLLTKNELHVYLAKRSVTNFTPKYSQNFEWKNPSLIQKPTKTSFDLLIKQIDNLVSSGSAWWPIKGATVRTETLSKVKEWTAKQMKHKNTVESNSKLSRNTSIDPNNFPDQNSKKAITTTSRILTLIESTKDFLTALEKAYGANSKKLAASILNTKIPSVLYVSSSIHSNGRAFKGDPFTGQISAYSRIFPVGINGKKERNMIAYYPNQLYSQFFDTKLQKLSNKGVKSLESNVDLIISRGGIMIDPKKWELL